MKKYILLSIFIIFFIFSFDINEKEYVNEVKYKEYMDVLTMLDVPSNVSLDENYIASWDSVENTSYYTIIIKTNDNGVVKTSSSIFPSNSKITEADGRLSYDLSNDILEKYKSYNYAGRNIKVSFSVKANAYSDSLFTDSEYSSYSNEQYFQNDLITKLDVPSNLFLSDDFVGSWDIVPNADHYYIYVYVNGYSSILGEIVYQPSSSSDGKVKKNFSSIIFDKYKSNGYNGEVVNVKFEVKAVAKSGTFFRDSAYSDYSNIVYYHPLGSTIVSDVNISPKKIVVGEGKTLDLSASILPEDVLYSSLKWSSLDTSIATVDNYGVVTGVSKGNTKIKVKVNSFEKEFDVSVYEVISSNDDVINNGVLVHEANEAINKVIKDENLSNTDIVSRDDVVNEIVQVAKEKNRFYTDIVNKKVDISTYNDLALLSSYDDYKLIDAYLVEVEISYDDGNHHVKVFDINTLTNKIYFSLDMSSNLIDLSNNKTRIFKVLRLRNNTLEEIDSKLVDNSLLIGTNKLSNYIILYKDEYIPVNDINLNKESLELIKGEEEYIEVSYDPYNASNKEYTSVSSNENVVKVIDNKIIAVGGGEAVVTFTSKDGNHVKLLNVKVNVPINGIAVKEFELKVGENKKLEVIYDPADTTVEKDIIWKISDRDVVSIKDGVITGLEVGSVTITAVLGDLEADYYFFVRDPVRGVKFNKESGLLKVGQTETLVGLFEPLRNSEYPYLTDWESSNSGVAKVENGVVYAISAGEAIIKAHYNEFEAIYTVTVEESKLMPVYRLYNRGTAEHLYTLDFNEATVLSRDHGWINEGIGWYSSEVGEPVFRLYNPILASHLYTTDNNEVDVLTTSFGWRKDNNGLAVFFSGGDIPIYRVYNKDLRGMHHLTTDENEYNVLPEYGWRQEGISFYTERLGKPNSNNSYDEEKTMEFVNEFKDYYWYLDGYEYAYIYGEVIDWYDHQMLDIKSGGIKLVNGKYFVTSEDTGYEYSNDCDVHNYLMMNPVELGGSTINRFNMRIDGDKLYISLEDKDYTFTRYYSQKDVVLSVNVVSMTTEIYKGKEFFMDVKVTPSFAYQRLSTNSYGVYCDKTVYLGDGIIRYYCSTYMNSSITFIDVWNDGAIITDISFYPIKSEIPVNYFKVLKDKIDLLTGKSEKIDVIFDPIDATDQSLYWHSSDEDVATVKDGIVRAVGKGKAIITVMSWETGRTEKVEVTVNNPSIEVSAGAGYSMVCNSSGCGNYTYVYVNPSGGSGLYDISYTVKFNGVLIGTYTDEETYFNKVAGTFEIEYTVTDSDGDTKSGKKVCTMS